MKRLNKARTQLHTEVKNLRNIEYMIQQSSFESLWIVSDDKQRNTILGIITARDKMRLMNWIRKHPSLELGEMSLAQLKEKGRELKIKNYSRMNKPELLMMIVATDKQEIIVDLTIKEMIAEISEFNAEMEQLMLEAGIPDEYLCLPDKIHVIDGKYIIEGYEWISEIYNNVYRDAKTIKNLLSEEMWERYSTWEDFDDHREVILLKDALMNLRKQVVNIKRPVLFKKSRIKLIYERALKRRKK
jgi:hypothetical protein